MKDWLGNKLELGDSVLYSSTSTLTGMNLAKITKMESGKVQVRLIVSSGLADSSSGKLVTLHNRSSAYKSITKYVGSFDGQV